MLSWVQSRLNRSRKEKQQINPGAGSTQETSSQHAHVNEIDSWSEILLSIGTLGNVRPDGKKSCKTGNSEGLCPPQDSSCSINELRKALCELDVASSRRSLSGGKGSRESNDPSYKRSLSIQLRLEGGESDAKMILRKTSSSADRENSTAKERSFQCLKHILKQFAPRPSPNLRDPTTMPPGIDKIMKTVLHKKVHPQSSATPSARRLLDARSCGAIDGDVKEGISTGGSKWVRTDTEYIVLEI